MPLREEFARSGGWLFRWRSYLPLILLALVLAQIPHFTYLGGSRRVDFVWEMICLSVATLGVVVRVLVVGYAPRGTSGRTTRAPEATELSTTGMYSVVRHPLYVGNLLIWIGIALVLHTWWVVALALLSWALYYERIMYAEEELLRSRFGDAFVEWAERTPAIIPNPKLWRPPRLAFSVRNAVGREYHLLLGVIVPFTVLDVAGDWEVSHRLVFDPVWTALFVASAALYALLRYLRRRTGVLSPPDR
jgi:protein-S-isoprenylcysteine O-methyltransferase Ste14